MSSSLDYSFISDKNENKKPVEKPKRNITIKKKKSLICKKNIQEHLIQLINY